MRVLTIGLLMSTIGIALDWYWHSIGISDDAYPVFPAHILLIFGLLVAAEGARRSYGDAKGHRRTILGVTAVAAGAAGLSRTYDELLHLQEIDASTQNMVAHLLGLVGLLVLLVGTAVAWKLDDHAQTTELQAGD